MLIAVVSPDLLGRGSYEGAGAGELEQKEENQVCIERCLFLGAGPTVPY